jgi:hypothetical protein
LPATHEWLWDIYNLEDNVLRTACLHEFVRETECLLSRVEKIDGLMKILEFSPQDCRKLLSHRISSFVESSEHEFEPQAQLIKHLVYLSDAIYPLSPHVLLGRQLRDTPFFSLGDEYCDDLLPDDSTKPGEDNLLPDSPQDESSTGGQRAKLNLSSMASCIRAAGSWVTIFRTDTVDCLTSVESNELANYGDVFPPDDLFDRDDGSRTSETTIIAIAAPLDVFMSNHSVMLARALTRRREPPKHLLGQVFRLEAEISIGSNEINVTNDFDGLGSRAEVEKFIVVATRSDADVTTIVAALRSLIIRVKESYGSGVKKENARVPSVLSPSQRLYPNKPNRTYFLAALCTISALRMGHKVGDLDYERMIEILNERSDDERKRISIPYFNRNTVRGSLGMYQKIAKRIFPVLSDEEVKPRTKGPWTIKG